ncbi:MAG: hypothetical protein FJ005_07980 [Chloroflexi bacterium]|nr:hypothetical protein [Chloroflexota bacterium]
MATWSTGYFIPYFSSQAIDFLVQAENISDKEFTALNYKWELFLIDKNESHRITFGEGILRGGLYKEFLGIHKTDKENKIMVDKPRIPCEFVSSGEYTLIMQFSHGGQAITNWLPMIKFDVIKSGELAVQLMLAGIGILGLLIGAGLAALFGCLIK